METKPELVLAHGGHRQCQVPSALCHRMALGWKCRFFFHQTISHSRGFNATREGDNDKQRECQFYSWKCKSSSEKMWILLLVLSPGAGRDPAQVTAHTSSLPQPCRRITTHSPPSRWLLSLTSFMFANFSGLCL